MNATQSRLAGELEQWATGRWGPAAQLTIKLVFASDAVCGLLTSAEGRRVQQACDGRTDSDYERYLRSEVELAYDLQLEAHGVRIPRFAIRFASRVKVDRQETYRRALPRLMRLAQVFNLLPWFFGINRKGVGRLLKKTIKECVTGGPPRFTADEFERHRRMPSVSFFLRVYIPCLARYQQTPQALYAKATAEGDPDFGAIEKLVECDPDTIHLPAIRRALQSSDRTIQCERYGTVGKGLVRELAPPEKGEIKNLIAGFISHLAMLTGKAATAPQIRRLLDIAAECRGGAIDNDLGAIQPASFSANVRNRRKAWEWVLAERGIGEAFRVLRNHAA